MSTNPDLIIHTDNILVVDDEIAGLRLLTEILEKEGYNVRPADSPVMALESALAYPPGLILLDVRMPGMSGFEVCRRLQQDERTRNIPIIFVTALQDIQDKIEGFEAGGVDFISKPFQGLEVLARVKNHLLLHRMQMHLEDLVTERTSEVVRAHAEVRESEERFRATFEQAAVGITHVSTEGRFLRINKKFCDITGYSKDEMLGLTFQNITHPDDIDADLEHKRLLLAGEFETYNVEKRYICKNGEIVWINLTVSLFREDKGTPRYFIAVVENINKRKWAEEELLQLKDQLQKENIYLREEIQVEHNFEEIIGNSEGLRYVLFRVEQIAATDTTVLILGETGTGKELIARAIHNTSPRKERPLIKVNCAVLPEHLIESELFGHEKGAFTGATVQRIGRFELADGATLFLDEIGEMPLAMQSKLLRVLQDGEFERVGSSRTIKVDVRLIVATNRDLATEMQSGRFRQDLFYRLNIYPLTLPPLRERPEDIPLLMGRFSKIFNKKLGKRIELISKKTTAALNAYSWPGNIRELQNVIEKGVILAQNKTLHVDLTEIKTPVPTDKPTKTLDEMERDYIQEVLTMKNWRIDGPEGAAVVLDLKPSTLRFRMQKLGIKRPS